MKKLLLASSIILASLNVTSETLAVNNDCEYSNLDYCDNALTNGLESNQTTLFYMYSTNDGHYFLDPLAYIDNMIFVEFNDIPQLENELTSGKRFIGTFTGSELLELESLIEVTYSDMEEK